MRDALGGYGIAIRSFRELSEVDLLAHYDRPDIPDRTDVHRLRARTIHINHATFSIGGTLSTDQQIIVELQQDNIRVHCSCALHATYLCYHEMLALVALITQENYRSFFDEQTRLRILLPYASRYGLENEATLDQYFSLTYDKGNLIVQPKQEHILAVDSHMPDKSLQEILHTKKKRPPLPAPTKQRILVWSKHRFYNQLRFELLDADHTQAGKPKAPFEFIDPTPLLWNTKDVSEAKLYAALANFQQHDAEVDEEAVLNALHIVCEFSKHLALYYHDQAISEKVNSKSLRAATLQLLDATIELHVFQRQPFYEIKAFLRWQDERFPLKTLPVHYRYFLRRQDHFYLLRDIATLRLLEYFRKGPETLLVHASKYDDFVTHTLQPLADIIHIHYAYVRPASPEESKRYQTDQACLIYLSQENSYVNITPVMRYGAIEIPLASKKQVLDRDENGHTFVVDRDLDREDKFQQIVAKQHPDFEAQQQEMHYFYLHHQHFLADEWFLQAFEAWRNEGIEILGFQEMNLNKLSPYKAKIDIKIVSGTDWFNVKIAASFGQQHLSIKQLHRAIRHKSKYVTLDDGRTGVLPADWLDKIARFFQFGVLEADLLRLPKMGLTAVQELFDAEILPQEIVAELDTLNKKLSGLKKRSKVNIPTTLKAQLRSYQLDGLHWLNQLDDLNLGGCLADDMGLGKTLQIIALLLLQKEKGQSGVNLVITPTSLLFNWEQELTKFAPSLRVLCLQGGSRDKLYEKLSDYDVVLCSYGLLVSDIVKLKQYAFNILVLDESQAIKNPSSERYKAARLLQARVRFVVTGTPIENSTYDLYGQLSFACPGLLGNQQFFRDTYATPIDRFDDSKRALSLQQKVAPFILRRSKQQVAKELPEKTEMVIYCEMGAQQREIYDSYEAELRDYLEGKSDDELQKSNMHILAGLTRLRQICNAPVLLQEGYEATISAKLDALMERLLEITPEHKVLVFSQFVTMLDLVKDALDNAHIASVTLNGKTKDRARVVDTFQQDETKRVFLISLKAGGVGLNLTAADYVFLIDPWWNPAVENQAIDRSYRIGQEKHVVAVRLICLNTVEEKIMHLQDKKRTLAGEMIKTDTDITQKFGKKDWLDLLQ